LARILAGVFAMCGLLAVANSWALSPVQFTDVSSSAQIGAYWSAPGLGSGVAAADFDDDGDIDLFVPNREGVPDQLYRNLGNGQFQEIGAAAGVASTARHRSALWFDYDADGLLDLLVAGDCYLLTAACAEFPTLILYHQVSAAVFQDVTAASGLIDRVEGIQTHRGGLAAGDLNGDGFLDLVLALWTGHAGLYLNNGGDGTFTDIGLASGVGAADEGHWQPMVHDFNGDGRQDIFFSVDFSENRLWINQGGHVFADVAPAAGVDNAWNDMGVAAGDYDNDGDLDLYVTNISRETGEHSVLYRNESNGAVLDFNEVSRTAGVDDNSWGWGATFLDADGDGHMDLAATNGYFNPWAYDASRFFLNDGNSQFMDQSDSSGFNDTYWGSSVVALDFDGDGDQDLAHTCVAVNQQLPLFRLLESTPTAGAPANHYLVVRPRSSGPNRRAIGAMVEVEIGAARMHRWITAGISFLGQEPAEAFFGLGAATMVDRVTVHWPDGSQTDVTAVAADQVLTIHGDPDTDGDGTADPLDGDDDADGIPDASDCAPTAAETWAVPGPLGLTLSHDGAAAALQWTPPAAPGGTILYYDVLASPDAGDFTNGASCLAANQIKQDAPDDAPLAPGEARYYVVRAGGLCGEGDAGPGRTLRACP
jgi:hypothetical protein